MVPANAARMLRSSIVQRASPQSTPPITQGVDAALVELAAVGRGDPECSEGARDRAEAQEQDHGERDGEPPGPPAHAGG